MIYGVYGVKDELRGFINIVLDDNDATAMRNFNNSALGIEVDYSLWSLGFFNTEDDSPIETDTPYLVCRGSAKEV